MFYLRRPKNIKNKRVYAGIQFVDAVVKQTYQQQILHQLLLQSEKFCDYYTFQQDGAPSHTSTKKYLHEN